MKWRDRERETVFDIDCAYSTRSRRATASAGVRQHRVDKLDTRTAVYWNMTTSNKFSLVSLVKFSSDYNSD